jgi:predicted PurR-regulated permease PerM
MPVAEPASPDNGRRELNVSLSLRTILLVAGLAAVAWALASIANVLLVIFVSLFGVAVLSPVVSAMERRLGGSRGLCATVLVLAIVLVLGVVALVLVQAISGSMHEFSDHLPQIVDKVRHSDLGSFVNGGSDSVDTLRRHAGDIANGVGKVSGGVAHVGVSAFGAVTLVFSVVFLTLFGLIDEPRWRDWIGSLLIAGVIIGIVALSVSLEALIVVLIVIVAYQQIENYILQPTIIGKAAQLSGFTVLASVLAFGALFGLIGAIIGVPIAAGLQIVAEELTAGRRARIAAEDAATKQAT